MQGLPARAVTSRGRGLLPHVFILTFNKLLLKAVIFCGTLCLRLPEARLLTGAWHCAVRTFLPFWKRRIDGPVCSGAKISSLPGAVAPCNRCTRAHYFDLAAAVESMVSPRCRSFCNESMAPMTCFTWLCGRLD